MRPMSAFSVVKAVRALFLFKCLVWVLFGVIFLIRFRTPMAPFLACLLFINALIFFWLAWVIVRRKAWIFYFSAAFLVANIILTVTDQMGIYDFIVLAIDSFALAALIWKRKDILPG